MLPLTPSNAQCRRRAQRGAMAASASATALVTGANRGIGLDTVRQLLRDGVVSHVYATSRDVGNVPE